MAMRRHVAAVRWRVEPLDRRCTTTSTSRSPSDPGDGSSSTRRCEWGCPLAPCAGMPSGSAGSTVPGLLRLNWQVARRGSVAGTAGALTSPGRRRCAGRAGSRRRAALDEPGPFVQATGRGEVVLRAGLQVHGAGAPVGRVGEHVREHRGADPSAAGRGGRPHRLELAVRRCELLERHAPEQGAGVVAGGPERDARRARADGTSACTDSAGEVANMSVRCSPAGRARRALSGRRG